jgi:hypothetical protein
MSILKNMICTYSKVRRGTNGLIGTQKTENLALLALFSISFSDLYLSADSWMERVSRVGICSSSIIWLQM